MVLLHIIYLAKRLSKYLLNSSLEQYYLGAYENIEDAIAARKAGEKAIYGDFLKWYAETHPEQWEKLKK